MTDTPEASPYPSPVEALRSKVRAILAQVKPGEVYALSEPARGLVQEEGRGQPVLLNPGDATLKDRELILLLTLYGTLSSELQSSFGAILLELTTVNNVRIAVPALVESGHVDQLCTALDVPPALSREELTTHMWSATRMAMSRRPYRFSNLDIARLERSVCLQQEARPLPKGARQIWVSSRQDFNAELDRVYRVIQLAQYHRMSEELLEANPEINTDQHVLVTRMEELGFRPEVVDALRELARKVNEAGKPLDFGECMRLAKLILEEIVEDAAKEAATRKGHPEPPAGTNNFQPWNQLLMNLKVLSEKQGEVTQKLYNYLSTAGSHTLGSAPEEVRVAKNTVVEWGLLIVGRVQAIK